MKAQGNALGRQSIARSVALKGRDRGPDEPGFRPFRASAFLPTRFPRALPWAVLFEPFRLQSVMTPMQGPFADAVVFGDTAACAGSV
jgi:hypothetical protein